MKRKSINYSIFILYLLTLSCAVRYYNDPAHVNNSSIGESENQTSNDTIYQKSPVVTYGCYGHRSRHQDFIKYALSLNEVHHGESQGNAVQRMREDKLEMPEYWFYNEGWQELKLDQKRALLAGSMTFLNWYMKDNKLFNDRERALYDHFSDRITVEEIVHHVDSMYKRPEYQDEDAENLIFDFMLYNFFDYMGQTIAYPG